MILRFLGAARTVTGSSHLIEVAGKRILLDCGLFQGRREEARRLNEFFSPHFNKLDAVILSHGHLDHCGRLPLLTRNGFAGEIYCTEPTASIARIVLEDSAQIQMEDAAYLNRRTRSDDQTHVQPLYTPADLRPLFKLFKYIPLQKRIGIGDVGVTLFDAGHILGSAWILVDWKTKAGLTRTCLFTADIGRFNTPIINDPHLPFEPADIVITESTYGGRAHNPMNDVEPAFLFLLQETIRKRSRLLIPSFALGRTQTMLWYVEKFILENKIPNLRVYIDSPMGTELTRVYLEHPASYDDQTSKLMKDHDFMRDDNVKLASTGEQSRQINSDSGPCVVIASSPSCEFGRILHHLGRSIEKPQDTVLFVGWTPPGTLGRRLQDGDKRVRIFDRYYDVKCKVTTLPGMSAHADGDEMIRFLKPAVSSKTHAFVVHGEADQSEVFASRLVRELGAAAATVPAMESSVFTDAAHFVAPASIVRDED